MLVWLCSPYKCMRQFSYGLKFRTFHIDLSKNNPSDPLIGTHVFLCLYLTSDVQPRDNVWKQIGECRTFWVPGWFISLQYVLVAHVRSGSCPWEYWLKEAITMQSVKRCFLWEFCCMRKQNFSLPVFVNKICLSAAFYISVLLDFFLYFLTPLFLSI